MVNIALVKKRHAQVELVRTSRRPTASRGVRRQPDSGARRPHGQRHAGRRGARDRSRDCAQRRAPRSRALAHLALESPRLRHRGAQTREELSGVPIPVPSSALLCSFLLLRAALFSYCSLLNSKCMGVQTARTRIICALCAFR